METQDFSTGTGAPALPTFFAPAERADVATLRRETQEVLDSPLFRAVQETIDGYLMVLNRQRQVLAVNQRLLVDLDKESGECLVGQRPGEVISCVHANECEGGCGTAPACSTCGAAISILASQEKGCPSASECLASVRRNSHIESAEFRVRATPVRLGDETFTVLVFNDISGDKRRETLERVFFHDILNTLSGLLGWSTLLEQRFDTIDAREVARKIATLSHRLHREIKDQQMLLKAETGQLLVSRDLFPISEIFSMVEIIFAAHDSAEDKTLTFCRDNVDEMVLADVSLLVRVMTNMIKNALEASRPGEAVRVWYERRHNRPTFLVHNPTVIPQEIALQIFKRSFSTKGQKGRGIGTYSMKLFGERYLKGSVDFESRPGMGTTFWISLPDQDEIKLPGGVAAGV